MFCVVGRGCKKLNFDYAATGCFQHTNLEHTPKHLYQQAIFRDSFHSWLGDGVCDIRVWHLIFVGMLLQVVY